MIQTFGATPKVLRTDLRAGEHVLVLMYHVGEDGASAAELTEWVPVPMRANLRRTLRHLEAKALVHLDDHHAVITRAGERAVEAGGLLDLE